MRRSTTGWTESFALAGLLLVGVGEGWSAAPAAAQTDPMFEEAPRDRFRFGIEARLHYRDSDDEAFASPFRFTPEMLDGGATQGFMATVDPGEHTEVSAVSLWGRGQIVGALGGGFKLDLIDKYDRNPTSEDQEWDLDEAWLRIGRETEAGFLAEEGGVYVKLGKFGKFERQDDRHLESYGLVSTAFNRFEDVGLELGVDVGRHFYVKASLTAGNPLFIRDPNALAGDNGVPAQAPPDFPGVPELGTGVVILYDTDVDHIDFDTPEVGLGLGARFGADDGYWTLDLLGWAYERELREDGDLLNTFYGSDLDLLRGPGNAFSLDVTTDEKQEIGLNAWLYAGPLTLFAQLVDQEVAGLDREGYEAEASWTFDLPLRWAVGGRQLFGWIAPAVRYSKLEPAFTGSPLYPAASIRWEWEKIDYGVRIGIWDQIDLTAEYQDNEFIRAGVSESNDELLVTLRLGFSRGVGQRR